MFFVKIQDPNIIYIKQRDLIVRTGENRDLFIILEKFRDRM